MAKTDYLLDNANAEASDRFAALSMLFDPNTVRQFEACGLSEGWRCWEVGAGGSALVNAISARVGESGYVLATDIDDGFAKAAASHNVEVRVHDVAEDPPPDDQFDLVHARLVLVHLRQRERAFQHMLAALKPGGWLVVEDADPALQPLSCLDVYGPAQELANKIRHGFRHLLAARGVDLSFGRKLLRMFREAGISNICAESYFPIARPECVILEDATVRMLRDDLVSNRLADPIEIDEHLRNVRSGVLDLSQPPMISVRGRKIA